jgi:hypothetical protein
MSDETTRPEDEEVEAHGPKPLGPKPGDRARNESQDEEPDVEAHGPKPLGPKPLGPKPL